MLDVGQRRRQPRPFAGDEAQILAEREGHDEDVGKEDRGVELGKALERLERDLGRGFAVIDEVEEAALVRREARDIREGSGRPGASSIPARDHAARRGARRARACRPACTERSRRLERHPSSLPYIYLE